MIWDAFHHCCQSTIGTAEKYSKTVRETMFGQLTFFETLVMKKAN